jgi:hypothetical protein
MTVEDPKVGETPLGLFRQPFGAKKITICFS